MRVLSYVFRRLVWAVLLVFVVTVLVFVMFFVLPANSRNAQRNDRGFVSALAVELNIHGSYLHQYEQLVGRIFLHGDLGDSIVSRDAVTDEIKRTVPVTASLVIGGAVLWLLLAVPIGFISAMRPRSLLDKGLMLFVLIGASAHSLWLSFVLSYVFGVKLHWLPVGGYCDFTYHADSSNLCGGPKYWAQHLVLPWIAFALLFAALYARMLRACLLEGLGEDYVRTARAKGASEWRVLRVHVLRNAVLPVVTMLGMDVGVAFSGALFIETVFQLPGMGYSLSHSLLVGDLPMIMGIVVVVCVAVVIANLFVDMVYAVIDPRIRRPGQGDSTVVSRAAGREIVAAQRQPARVSESATTP